MNLSEDTHDGFKVEGVDALGSSMGLEFVEKFANGVLWKGGDDVSQDE